MTPQEAYARCEAITREQAKNFAFGIRLLPPPKRAAMSAVYAYARRIDDISDGDAPAPAKLAALADVRADTDTLRGRSFRPDDAVLVALADAGTRYPIPWDAFDDLVTGCESDARGEPYTTIDELVQYCRYVAGSIGRLSLSVFGTDDWPRAVALADDLGVALQLTNILRDVPTDLARGRVYIPQEDLRRHGCSEDDLASEVKRAGSGIRSDGVRALLRAQGERAREYYRRAARALPRRDAQRLVAAEIMGAIYRGILARIERRDYDVFSETVRVPRPQRALIAAATWARTAVGL